MQATHLPVTSYPPKHPKQIISVSKSSFGFCICCLQVDRHSTLGLPSISLCRLFLSFTYSMVHFHLCAVSFLLQPENLAFTGRFQLKIVILFQNREKMYSFVLVEQNFPLIPLMSHMLAEGLDFTQ